SVLSHPIYLYWFLQVIKIQVQAKKRPSNSCVKNTRDLWTFLNVLENILTMRCGCSYYFFFAVDFFAVGFFAAGFFSAFSAFSALAAVVLPFLAGASAIIFSISSSVKVFGVTPLGIL